MRISNSLPNKSGFTLIELMVSLVIIGVMVGMTVPRLGKTLGTQIRSATQKIVTINKELHTFARLRNKTYRLAITLGDKKHAAQLSVESATSKELLQVPDEHASGFLNRKKDKEPPSPFTIDTEVLKKPLVFPEGVYVEDVELAAFPKPITEGIAYIHFFPEGLVQQAIIHITDGGKIHWSLIVNPLTGATDIQSEHKTFKDIQQ